MSLVLEHFYRFGEFTVDSDQRVLLCKGKPLPLTPKVFDTLLMLVENPGKVVTKAELMNQLWPDSFVVEANLTFNIQQLRKSLGDKARHPLYIETVARRGYRFIANVDEVLSDGSMKVNRFASGTGYPDDEQALSNGRKTEVATTNRGADAALILDQRSVLAGRLPAPASSADLAASGWRKSSFVLGVFSVVVLSGLGLLFWKINNGSQRTGADKGLARNSGASAPLKLERLSQDGQNRLAAISPDGKYVAYVRIFEKKSGIWLRPIDADTNVEIVPAAGVIGGLTFAHSGDYVYFVKGDPTALYRVALIGGAPTKIVDTLEGNFSISSDDRQIAFIRQVINRDGQRQYSLMIANSDGTNERPVLVGTHPDDLDVPVWTPNNLSIICAYGNSSGGSQNVRILEVNVADGTQKELLTDRFFHISKMAWLPEKRGLIISGRKNDQDIDQLWRLTFPGMELRQITDALNPFLDLSLTADATRAIATQAARISDIFVGPAIEARNLKRITQAIDEFCWTPNGRLVYSSTASVKHDLWIMRPDGTEQRQLTVSSGWNGMPAVTADNRFIVFTSNRSGSRQVWRMDIDGGNQVQLTSGATTAYPAISSDGRWVLYNTTDDWHLWKISIDGGAPSPLTAYVASHPSVSPDGKTIACVGRTESKRELLILPIEGGQALKKLEFAGWGSRLVWTNDGKALVYASETSGATAIVKQPLDGGAAERIVDVDEDNLFDFGYSFDGQYLAVTRGGWQHDIVLINDLNRY